MKFRHALCAAVLALWASQSQAGYDLDGAGDNLTLTGTANLAGYPFTACGWFLTTSVEVDMMFSYGVASSNDNRWTIRVNASNNLVGLTRTTSNSVLTSSNTFTNATWSHACMRATSSSDVDIFLSGTKTDGNPALTPAGGDQLRFGESGGGSEDFTGSLSHWAVWSIALSDGEVSALAGGDNPLTVQNDGDLEAYWPMTADPNDAVNSFDLNVTNATLDVGDNAPVDAPPGGGAFTVNPTVTAQDTNDFTIGGTTDASVTVSAVACAKDSTAPSIAQVVAADCTGDVNALAAVSETWNGADSFVLGGSLPLKVYDLYVTNGSTLITLADEQLDVASGYERTILSTQDPTSVYDGTETVSGDYCDTEAVTDPSAYVVTPEADGTLSYAAGGDTSRQIILGNCHDLSESDIDSYQFVFNNLAPDPIGGSAFDDPYLFEIDTALTPVDLEALAPDPESDTVTVTALESLSTGLSIVANELVGTPTVYGNTLADIQWEDQYGATYVEEISLQIGALVPSTSGLNEAAAIAAIEAVASFTALAGAPAFSASIPVGEVISTDPANGELSPFDQTVTYFLSLGAGASATEAKIIFELSSVTGLTQWVDYIPVAVLADCVPGRYDEDGCWNVEVLSSTTGLTAWVDYIPVFEVAQSANKWRYENDGWIPVNTLTP